MISWKKRNLLQKLSDRSSVWFIFFISFYSAQAVLSLFSSRIAPTMDLGAAVFILSVLFMIHIKVNLPKTVPLFTGIGLFPHLLGLYKMAASGFNLYGWSALNYHYDLIVHSFAMFCYTIAFCSMIYPYLKRGLKSRFLVFIIILFFMSGIGAFNESLEYVGFDILGYGEGFLEFGDGDFSPVGGPWENASLDMLANLFGALAGAGAFIFLRPGHETKN